MKRILILSAAATVIVAGAGIAGVALSPHAQAAPGYSQCIDASSLDTKMVVSSNQIVVQDMQGHGGLLTLGPPCTQMEDLDHVGFEFDGDSRICSKHDVKILYSHGMDDHERPLRCIITNIKPLTRDEVKAYSSSGH